MLLFQPPDTYVWSDLARHSVFEPAMRTNSAQIGHAFASRSVASPDAGRPGHGPHNLPRITVGDLHPEDRLGALDRLLLVGLGRFFRVVATPEPAERLRQVHGALGAGVRRIAITK